MRGFQNGDLERSYISEMAPKRRSLMGFLQFLGNKLITLSKVTQSLKLRACFMQNFMELDMKKLLDPKAVTFGVWDLKIA